MNIKSSDPRSILAEIAQAEQQLASLRSEQKKIESNIQSLKAHLEHIAGERNSEPCQPIVSSPVFTPEEKILLFRRLFQGREDVYPKLWINKKTGRKGYSPACSNEWVEGVCKKKSGVKCSKCTTQSFLPVTNDTILDHLQGRHIIGIYPMLHNETCWFLAADFDKQAWKEDVVAFAETCNFVFSGARFPEHPPSRPVSIE